MARPEMSNTGDGELRWNLKASFRSYVQAIEDGAETWLADVGALHQDELIFEHEASPTPGEWRYRGRVRFSGYRGMLMVNLADPWVVVGDAGLTVSVDVAPAGTTPQRVDIANGPSRSPVEIGSLLVWDRVPLVMTGAGASVLGGVYQEGDELDDLTFSVTQQEATG